MASFGDRLYSIHNIGMCERPILLSPSVSMQILNFVLTSTYSKYGQDPVAPR